MTHRQGDPDSIRRRFASAISPERVALALVIVLAIVILLIVGLGPPAAVDLGRPSPTPVAATPSSSS